MNNDAFGKVTSAIAGGGVVVGMTTVNNLLETLGFIIAIVSGIISICFTIYKWYKKVTDEKSEGGNKITKEEIKEGLDTIVPLVETIKDKIENKEENGNANNNKQ